MKNTSVILASLSVVALTSVHAAPTIGDIEKQVSAPEQVNKTTPVPPKLAQPEYQPPLIDSGKSIFIKGFTITGNKHISSELLLSLIESEANKELSFSELRSLVSKVTRYYREEGYFVAKAYIPKQTLAGGLLEIAVVEGYYGDNKLQNDSLVKDSVVQSMLDESKKSEIIQTRSIERAMLLINDTPGVLVTQADISPGNMPGTSDFILRTEATAQIDGYLVADNMGGRYTGENRGMAGINLNSPLNIGDKLSISGLISEGGDLNHGAFMYSAPILSNGLTAQFSYSETGYSLTGEFKALDAVGSADTTELRLSYPIIRTRHENLNLGLSLIHKDLEDEIRSTSDITGKSIKSIKADLGYEKHSYAFDVPTFSKASVILTHGELDFDDPAKATEDLLGPDTQGSFSKININLSHAIALTDLISLEADLQLQHSFRNKNLDGSEDLSIGGANGVKLYPDGEISAENGYLLTLEAKYKLPEYQSLSHSVGLFYDVGRVNMADNTSAFASKTLHNIGVGYYATYDNFFTNMQVAWKAGSENITTEPDYDHRFLLQAGMTF